MWGLKCLLKTATNRVYNAIFTSLLRDGAANAMGNKNPRQDVAAGSDNQAMGGETHCRTLSRAPSAISLRKTSWGKSVPSLEVLALPLGLPGPCHGTPFTIEGGILGELHIEQSSLTDPSEAVWPGFTVTRATRATLV